MIDGLSLEPRMDNAGCTAACPVDLHCHSTFSDGELAPAALVERAAARGVRVLSLTDHDTLDGLPDAHAAADVVGLRLVDGIEISAWHRREIHVLGYFVDRDDAALREVTARQRTARVDRVYAIADKLATLGIHLDADAVLADAGPGNVGRPHIAAALIAAGHARDKDDVFDRLLGSGKPAYVPAARLPAADAIALVHAAGGVAVLAHPGVEKMDHALGELAAAGLDGVECAHPAHDPATAARYRGLAEKHGLVPTGGSDFHHPHGIYDLGSFGTDAAGLAALEARRP